MKSFVFIGGAPRSGTTLFQKMLDMHSQISAGPEFDHLPKLMHLFSEMSGGVENGRQSCYYAVDDLRKSFRALISELLAGRRKGLVVSEKTPDNAFFFEELFEVFPDAKFILIVRDPRAIVSSFKTVSQRARKIGRDSDVPIGKRLQKDVYRIYRAISRGSVFVSKNPSIGKIVYYEDLVQMPEKTIKDVCKFIGVSFEPKMLETHHRNEMTALVERMEGGTIPFVSPLFDKAITNSAVDNWRQSLSSFEKFFINDFFMRNRIQCLNRYEFVSPNIWLKMRILLYRMIAITWSRTGIIVRNSFGR